MSIGTRACYHILEHNGPNNDFKFDDQLLEYCTWTGGENTFYYLCRWVHSRHHNAVERKYSYAYTVHKVEDPRVTWNNATALFGYTRPERYYEPTRTARTPQPSLRTTLEDVMNFPQEEQFDTYYTDEAAYPDPPELSFEERFLD